MCETDPKFQIMKFLGGAHPLTVYWVRLCIVECIRHITSSYYNHYVYVSTSESDSDSGTEELVQQEYQRRLEARHKQQAADKEKPSSSKSDSEVAQPSHVNSSNIQSAHNDAVSNGTNHNLTVQSDPEGILQDSNKDETIIESRPISSEQKAIATLDVQQSKSTVSSTTLNATEGVNTASTLGLHISSASNSEDLYSPGKSIIERSSPAPSQKFHPSR